MIPHLVKLLFLFTAIALVGCASPPPDQMGRAAFESWLENEAELTNVSLQDDGAGGFKGTGTHQGEKVDLVVTRKPKDIHWSGTYTGPNLKGGFTGARAW